jgi:hypothetical protein
MSVYCSSVGFLMLLLFYEAEVSRSSSRPVNITYRTGAGHGRLLLWAFYIMNPLTLLTSHIRGGRTNTNYCESKQKARKSITNHESLLLRKFAFLVISLSPQAWCNWITSRVWTLLCHHLYSVVTWRALRWSGWPRPSSYLISERVLTSQSEEVHSGKEQILSSIS